MLSLGIVDVAGGLLVSVPASRQAKRGALEGTAWPLCRRSREAALRSCLDLPLASQLAGHLTQNKSPAWQSWEMFLHQGDGSTGDQFGLSNATLMQFKDSCQCLLPQPNTSACGSPPFFATALAAAVGTAGCSTGGGEAGTPARSTSTVKLLCRRRPGGRAWRSVRRCRSDPMPRAPCTQQKCRPARRCLHPIDDGFDNLCRHSP